VKTAAIVGWSGNGGFSDLEASVSSKLGLGDGATTKGAKSLTVREADPVVVARKLAFLPGVSWVCAGYEFDDKTGPAAGLQLLAKRYMRPGSSFLLTAQVEQSEREEGDILLDGNGLVLKSVSGTRVDEKSPDVTFRIVIVRNKGAVGVQLREGPGGVPTSRGAKATCLVSGGYHSAVVAWMAALSGFSVTLVHARADDESLRQVGRLYAELSQRLDPSTLKLLVLDGVGSPGERLATWLDGASGDVIAGVHPECRGRRARAALKGHPSVLTPLLLLQEDEVRAKLDSLGIKVKGGDRTSTLSVTGRKTPYVVRRYGGRESDINGVLDGLLR
jgi:hypothetical protein